MKRMTKIIIVLLLAIIMFGIGKELRYYKLINNIEVEEFNSIENNYVLIDNPNIEKGKEVVQNKVNNDNTTREMDEKYSKNYLYGNSTTLKPNEKYAKEEFKNFSHIRLKIRYNFLCKGYIDVYTSDIHSYNNMNWILYGNIFYEEDDEKFCKELWNVFVTTK